MRMLSTLSVAFLFAFGSSFAVAQEDKKAPDQEPEDDELTPAQAIELLKEAKELMGKAEELLNDSSRGKALETEKELLAKLERDFKDIPAGEIMKKVGRVIEKAQKRQKDVIEKINEIIKKAKT